MPANLTDPKAVYLAYFRWSETQAKLGAVMFRSEIVMRYPTFRGRDVILGLLFLGEAAVPPLSLVFALAGRTVQECKVLDLQVLRH